MRYILGCGDVDCIDFDEVKGPLEGSCEYGFQPSGSVKCGIFLDSLNRCPLLKKGIGYISLFVVGRNTPDSSEC
jgi:hypothetical protein